MNSSSASTPKPRYILIGGFLGAGKTTASARLAEWLRSKGKSVGLITNDQGRQLVDTTLLRARGFPVEEIPGGCFCCRFDSLVEASDRLTTESRPDYFLAEPVGSCTDLVATVTYPLGRLYEEQYSIAPFSVLVDPARAVCVLGLVPGRQFSDNVNYIYRKQLEEAQLIVINKCDLMGDARRMELRDALAGEFPHAQIFEVSSRTGEGLEPWFTLITNTPQTRRAVMEVDYEIYADGEARLGWLNATLQLTATTPVDANRVLTSLAAAVQLRLKTSGAEVAHLKMTLDPGGTQGELCVLNLVRNDAAPELAQRLAAPVNGGQLLVNLRAEGEPELLRESLRQAVDSLLASEPALKAEWTHLESFKPGKPQPTHRDTPIA